MPYYGSTRATIRWNGDDTFTSYEQPSESTVFKGELFKEKERVFLRRTLRRTQVSFPIGGQATVQLVVQVFWQPEAADFKFKGKGGRPGRFVTLLHDAQGPISDAWAWIKLVRPLYRRGFSVILPNLPGCGGSAANADTNAKHPGPENVYLIGVMWHRSLDESPHVQGHSPLVASSPYVSKREPGKPPPGYRPLQKCTVCPPGGIWLAIFTYYLDYVNDMVQIITFLLNHHYWFASFMALTQALSLCVTIYYHKQDESQITQKKLRSRHGFAFEEGRMSLRIGVPTRQWQFLMHVEEVIEAPATGLVGAYGMSLVPTLTSIQAASGMYGLIASALAMGRGRMGYEARCRGPPRFALPVAALKSLCPTAATSALLGYQTVFATELAIFAVVSTVLHPIVGLAGFCSGFLIDAFIDVRSGADLEANGFFGGPNVSDVWSLVNVMAGRHTKVFFPTSAGCYGVIPRLFVVVRLAVCACLCSLTDLPNGLLPLGTLGRPMGHSVLQEMFLDAATACRESIGCLLEGEVCWPEAAGQSVPSTMFHAALFLLALGLGSLLILTTFGLAVYVYSACPDMSETMVQDIARRTSVFVRGQSDSDDKELELLSRLWAFLRCNLYVNRTHIVAMGRSARVLMKFARFTKIDDGSSFLAKENCWFQPDIDFFAMFHDVVGDCPPGHKKEWYASATHQHAHLLREVLKHLRLLSFFDEASAPTEIQDGLRLLSPSPKRIGRWSMPWTTKPASPNSSMCAFLERTFVQRAPMLLCLSKSWLLPADIETDLSKCSVGCVNPEKGLHHWNCPNHPKNKDRLRFKLMMEAQMASTPEKKPGPQRPASAPVRRPVGHEEWSGNRPPVSPSLGAARSRRGTELIWTTSSQKGPVKLDIYSGLSPKPQNNIWIQEERVEEELRKQEVLSPMGSPMPSPKGAKSPQSQSLPSPSIDGTNSEIFPEDFWEDFLVARGSLNAERALRASHDDPLLPSEKALSRSASKLSKHSKQSVPVSGGGSDIAFGELEVDYVMTPPGSPTMLARFPSKPSLLAQDSPIRGNSKLSASFRPDVEVRDVTGEDRGLMLLKDLSPPSTPASLSRPSSAKRLSNYFSSKLNRLSRPASALLRRSSSATFSDSSPGSLSTRAGKARVQQAPSGIGALWGRGSMIVAVSWSALEPGNVAHEVSRRAARAAAI
eukprot:s26_g4.t3